MMLPEPLVVISDSGMEFKPEERITASLTAAFHVLQGVSLHQAQSAPCYSISHPQRIIQIP